MSSETRFPRFTVAGGFELIPPTVLVLTGNPLVGAAALGGVLAIWVVHARMIVRARHAREAQLLDYAQVTTNLGGDPAPVLRELRQRVPERRDDRALFDPDDEDGWVHLHPSDW